MTIESISKFSAPAVKLWANIPEHHKKLVLANVWCWKCKHEVTITNFSGAVKAGELLLVGVCSECHNDVARVIETTSMAFVNISIYWLLQPIHWIN